MFQPKVDRISYGGASIGLEEVKAVMDCMLTQGGTRWTVGENSVKFEEELAEKTGVKRAVVVNSGSSALLVALTALHLPKGSKVIIPAVNFPTAFNAIIQCGLVPYVVDVDIKTLNLDLEEVKKAVEKTDIKAVIAVNIASNPVDYRKLRKIVGEAKIICDNCLAKGTLVKTIDGDVAIEDVKVGDMVLTRKGYKKVLRHMNRGVQPVVTRFGVTATADHPFITTKGKVDFNELQPSDILYSCELPTKETNIIDIQNPNIGIKESIGTALVSDLDIYTDISGKTSVEKFQTDTLSTTETETLLTTIFQILKQLRPKNILNYTSKKMEDWKQQIKTSIKQELRLLSGTNLVMVGSFTPSIINGSGLLEKNTKNDVLFAEMNTRRTGRINQSIVQGVANQKAEVYDLTVEDAHEFFANGILVSNCDGYGTLVDGRFVDTYADISCVSFHAAHIITTGEGGACLTNDTELADRCLKLREWGRATGTDEIYSYPGFPDDYRSRYVYEEIGYNMKPLELQCAMGRVQLKRLEGFREARLKNAKRMRAIFEKYPQFELIDSPTNAEVCWFSFPLLCKGIERKKVMDTLEENNIECRTIFSGNVLRHPAYKDTEYIAHGEMVNADRVMKDGMFLSVHPSITDEMLDFIDKVVGELCK